MNIATATRTRYGVLKERSEGFGGHGGGVPPVPIPNTEVKPARADGTWTEGSRESRSLPTFREKGRPVVGRPFLCSVVAPSTRCQWIALGSERQLPATMALLARHHRLMCLHAER